ncbi:MAG TPA: sterol desaturase family protein [Syntrophales bacterium]|nr:sterol desaturase family protein [Syntrophales bacterium]
MNSLLLNHEPFVRAGFFFGILILMAVWERLAPRRQLKTSRPIRWFSNLGIIFISTLVLRLLPSFSAMAVAVLAERAGWGLLNNAPLAYWLKVAIGVAVLDLAIYLQHAMFHGLPILWRLHMMHHSDLDFDVTTGVRFHPIEILLSMGIKMMVVFFAGISVLGVLIFEVLLNATSMFNHGNVRLAASIDRVLRFIVVTPEMHRVHHSVVIRETNSNFGFNLPWWDRLFGTYKAQPAAGHEGMNIGLSQFRDSKRLTLPWLLVLPFIGQTSKYPMGP